MNEIHSLQPSSLRAYVEVSPSYAASEVKLPGISSELIADAIAAVDGGERKEPWLLPVPIGVFDGIVGAIKWVYDLTGSDQVRDAWELGKIGRYYAVEDMLTTAEAERYGAMSLREHYENVAKNGQEYDPYTTVFAKNPLIK